MNDYYQYLKRLHTFIENQDRRVRALEKVVENLQREVSQLKTRPPLHVDTIQYSFDQLKVETLEGTLHIGVNPSDLEDATEFAVGKQAIQTPFSPKPLFQRTVEIENELRHYLETDLPELYEATLAKLNFTVDESYYDFIKNDIIKQLPNRISTHLNSLPPKSRENEQSAKQMITDKLKSEIDQGVFLFLNQLKEQTKGNSQ
ncbi:spore germination protein GerPC [Bacillus sp. B15-48]|uniref:spore germination protein GerPC n=1 Tax=Bacillus sp. B15-48 TaxID=1548601 RepID=UPI00193F40C3